MTFATLADYKLYKKLTKTENDAQYQLIIDSVNSLFQMTLGRELTQYYTTPKVEYVSTIKNQKIILLTEFPIKEITLVEMKYQDSEDYQTVTDYYLNPVAGSIHAKYYWPCGTNSVRVTYTAGYAEVPSDLKLAALDMVHYYIKEEYIENRQIGNAQMISSVSKDQWPKHIARVLDMYRNV